MTKPPVYSVHLFTETTKWKYQMHLIMLKDDMSWAGQEPFTDYIELCMKNTPSNLRGVTLTSIPEGWYAVCFNNPLGFPIMALKGKTVLAKP